MLYSPRASFYYPVDFLGSGGCLSILWSVADPGALGAVCFELFKRVAFGRLSEWSSSDLLEGLNSMNTSLNQ